MYLINCVIINFKKNMRFAIFVTFLCSLATISQAKDLKFAQPLVGDSGLPSKSDAVLFVTGFIERLTGKNELVAINECFKNGTDISRQIYTIMTDMAKRDKFDIEDAMLQLMQMISQVDQRLSNCSTDIQPEIDRISSWVNKYNTTKDALVEMSKNIAENQMLILTIGSTIPVFISQGEYYRVGETIADVLQLVIGKIPKVQMTLKTESIFENVATNTEESAIMV